MLTAADIAFVFSSAPAINPASGLPMLNTAYDLAGNRYGESFPAL